MDLIVNQGNWNDLKDKLRKKYPQLTDMDMQHTEGLEEGMLRMVEYKLRMTKEQLREVIAEIGYTPSEIP